MYYNKRRRILETYEKKSQIVQIRFTEFHTCNVNRQKKQLQHMYFDGNYTGKLQKMYLFKVIPYVSIYQSIMNKSIIQLLM
jgi:hypothetical protein